MQEFNSSDAFDLFYFSSLLHPEKALQQDKSESAEPAKEETDSENESAASESPEETASKNAESQAARPLPLDIIIVGNDAIKGKKTADWVTKAATLLRKANLWPAENRPKFVIIRFEDTQLSKANYSHPFIDDLIFLPPDRLMFLQKLELILNLPKNIEPSYLFVQETDEPLEIAKQVKAINYSDLTLTIENPLPMVQGSYANVRFRLPGETNFTSFFGKVILSEAMNIEKSIYNITFAMSLVSKQTVKKLRAKVTQDVSYKLLQNADSKDFEYNPDNIFLTEQEKESKTVVIIDPDENFSKHLATTISKEIGNCRTIHETSWAAFYQNYLEDVVDAENVYCTDEDLYAENVEFTFNLMSRHLMKLETQHEEESTLLGWKASELFEAEENWLRMFDDERTEAQLKDILLTLPLRKKIFKTLRLSTPTYEKKLVGAQFELMQDGLEVKLTLSKPESESARPKAMPLNSLDALLIHQALVSTEPEKFMENLSELVRKKALRSPKSGVSCFLLTEKENLEEQEKFLHKGFWAVFNKPIDNRQILHWICSVINSPFCIYKNENIGQKETTMDVKLGTPARLKALSEFGASVQIPHKLRVGSMFYLFGSIFKNAPSGNICCRVYSSKESEEEKGLFINNLLYFGINDSFLKLTRNFIREAYANAKANKGS